MNAALVVAASCMAAAAALAVPGAPPGARLRRILARPAAAPGPRPARRQTRWGGRRAATDRDAAAHAILADELAALCAAGLEPRAAWAGLAGGGGDDAGRDDAGRDDAGRDDEGVGATGAAGTVAAVRSMILAGGDPADALARLRSPYARRLALAWRTSTATGAPLAAVLEQFAEAARADVDEARDRAVALAGPRASGRLLGALPGAGPLLGLLLGADPLAVLLGTPAGRVCLLTGSVLWAAGHLWATALVRSAERAAGSA